MNNEPMPAQGPVDVNVMPHNGIMVTINFNRFEMDAWIDKRRLPDGSYALVGMGRSTEYDAKTGEIVSEKIEPTGLTGWAPRDAFDERFTLMHRLRGMFSVRHNAEITGSQKRSF